jgi:hypothetical protein
MLRELLEMYKPQKRGVVSVYEKELIEDDLHIKEMDILQLRNLRDFVVVYLGKSEEMIDWDRMSAITSIIDKHLFDKGADI